MYQHKVAFFMPNNRSMELVRESEERTLSVKDIMDIVSYEIATTETVAAVRFEKKGNVRTGEILTHDSRTPDAPPTYYTITVNTTMVPPKVRVTGFGKPLPGCSTCGHHDHSGARALSCPNCA